MAYRTDAILTGLKQKSNPNVAQTAFIRGKYVTIMGQPIKKSRMT